VDVFDLASGNVIASNEEVLIIEVPTVAIHVDALHPNTCKSNYLTLAHLRRFTRRFRLPF